MNKQDIYSLDEIVYKKIQENKEKKEEENKAYFDGMEKGAELFMKTVRDYLSKESESGGVKE